MAPTSILGQSTCEDLKKFSIADVQKEIERGTMDTRNTSGYRSLAVQIQPNARCDDKDSQPSLVLTQNAQRLDKTLKMGNSERKTVKKNTGDLAERVGPRHVLFRQ
ncbi:hypothetical protein Bbelb_019370 [Branchiostoma belcheri]|nr:hypothetical protein Bbelb_019370 [Branchiostoma belcheri]